MIRRTLQLAGLGAVLVGLLACAPKPPANAAVTPNAVSENAVSEAAVSEAAGPAVEKASLLVPHPVLGHIDPVLEALGEQRCETLFQRFDANMKAALPPEKLKVVCRQILEGTGAIERVELVSLDERRGRFEVKAANGAQRLTLTVGDNAAIAGLMMKPAPRRRPRCARSPA